MDYNVYYNVLNRILVVLTGFVIFIYAAFKQTPELDDVKSAWFGVFPLPRGGP